MPEQASCALLTRIAGSVLIGTLATGCTVSRPQARPLSPDICEEAVVSPVTGYAECVRPRGAPVDPPPPRPDKPCSEIAQIDTEEARYCAANPETSR
jgi:hypothetical protein